MLVYKMVTKFLYIQYIRELSANKHIDAKMLVNAFYPTLARTDDPLFGRVVEELWNKYRRVNAKF